MRLASNVATGCLLACGIVSASSPACVSGTLASYIALGAKWMHLERYCVRQFLLLCEC